MKANVGVLRLLLFLSDGSPTSLLSLHSPGRVIVDWQPSPGHLAGGQGGRVRGQQAQPGGGRADLLHGPVCELIHSQEVSLDSSSEQSVVSLNRKYIDKLHPKEVNRKMRTVDLSILKLTLMMPRFCVKTPCLKACSAAEE